MYHHSQHLQHYPLNRVSISLAMYSFIHPPQSGFRISELVNLSDIACVAPPELLSLGYKWFFIMDGK